MKKLFKVLVCLWVLTNSNVFSLPAQCPTGDINLSRQSQIDSFPITYPGCTDMSFSITIKEDGPGRIFSLNGLRQLTRIRGSLIVKDDEDLKNVNGLSSLTSIGGNLTIQNNWFFENVDGLASVTSIGGSITFVNNSSLKSITGLMAVRSISGAITLTENYKLPNLSGLDNIDYRTITNFTVFHNFILTLCGC